MFHRVVMWEVEMLGDESEEPRSSLNSGGITASIPRKMNMRKPRRMGTANTIQWLTIVLCPSGGSGSGTGEGDGGLSFAAGGTAGRLAIGGDYCIGCFLLFCGRPWEKMSNL